MIHISTINPSNQASAEVYKDIPGKAVVKLLIS